jgi:Uncharacterized membrane protein, required for colicin V production
MNLIDIIVVLMILLAGVIGMKRGFFKGAVMSLGWFVLFILAFKLKDPIAEGLSLYLPFFNFWGTFKDVTVLNIILYQLIAFLIVYSILMIIYVIVVKLTGVIESLLNATIILGIPSKILGFILGLLEGFILMFIIIFIFALPFFNFSMVNQSIFSRYVLGHTPLMSNVIKSTNDSIKEITDLKDKFKGKSDKEELNKECLKVLLKHKLVTTEHIEKLVDKGKLKMKGIDGIINEYK